MSHQTVPSQMLDLIGSIFQLQEIFSPILYAYSVWLAILAKHRHQLGLHFQFIPLRGEQNTNTPSCMNILLVFWWS